MNLAKYKSIVFDCDGVILNSNKIKTEAFRIATSSFGKDAMNNMVSYHLLNGGISRYQKFDYFLTYILKKKVASEKKELLNKLLNIYAYETDKRLLNSEVTYGLEDLRNKTKDLSWSIVSGGDQHQLNYILEYKRIKYLFDGGIYGSPENKNNILKREIINSKICLPALFLGDSILDHNAAVKYGLEFVFVSSWTDFKSYKSYCLENSIKIIDRAYDLID